jgi:hypothetical protein
MDSSNNDPFNMIIQLTRDYIENMNDYHSNMRHLIHILENIPNTNQMGTNQMGTNQIGTNQMGTNQMGTNQMGTNNRQTSGYTNITSDILYRFIPRNIRDQMHGYMEDVVVRPTQLQIDRAVECFVYDPTEEYIEGRCPISLENFVEGEQLSRIRYCRHVFKQGVLNDWFSRNVHCPVCRYDIRETPISASSSNPSHSNDYIDLSLNPGHSNDYIDLSLNHNVRTPRSSNSNPIIETLGNALHTFIQNEVDNNGFLNEMMYTFDIPIIDASNNRYRF